MREAIITTMAGETGYHSFFEPFRKKVMVAAYRPVGKDCTWSVFCMAPYAEFFGSIDIMVRVMIISIVVVVIAAIILSIFVASIIIRPLLTVDKAINEIASGSADLTRRIEVTSNDEIGNVVKGFNKFTEKLQVIITAIKASRNTLVSVGNDMSASVTDTATSIGEILNDIESVHQQINGQSKSVQQTAGAVNEIASNIESLERMIGTQAQGVSQASAAVEEMIGNIASVNINVDKMASSFDSLQQTALNGSAKQDDVNDRIKQIESQSEMLQEANAAIAAIAEQT
ncbi:MAG: methyl-accepting chemotaxis protein, partial [Treponema sp.]|nr:methyl-accepting chemotaxis protein [Treponema sp.]